LLTRASDTTLRHIVTKLAVHIRVGPSPADGGFIRTEALL
jgi:hypothetical protein